MQRGWLRLGRVAQISSQHSFGAVRAISASTPLDTTAGAGYKPSPRAGSRKSGVRSSSPRAKPKESPASLLKKNAFPSTRSRRTSHSQVAGEIEALVDETNRHGARFEPSKPFFRRASVVLQQCKTREQCIAALPLCYIMERVEPLQVKDAMECVRIFQRAGRNREVMALTDKLVDQEIFLLNPALASAIQACAALGEVEKGFQLFHVAVNRGSIPNLGVYSALLAVAGAAGDPQRVQEVLEQMKKAGVEMNAITFHNLMSAYAHGGHVSEALALFEKMQAQGIQADNHTYSILMDAYAENGDFEGAQALMNELKNTPGLEPNLVHYNVLIKSCGKESKLATAFELYEEMKDRKIQPDLITYITMMHAVYHGELSAVDTKKVKTALVGLGVLGASCVPMINFEEYMMTTLFWSSLLGSMGLAAYMNPDGVMRALYPNSDEPRNDTVIEAFFRRLGEEDHSGRAMYLWREMQKFNVPPDPRVYDVLVRICVRKRHPNLAYEAVFEENLPLADSDGAFVLSLPTTLSFLHSLLAQKRLDFADNLFAAGQKHHVFKKVFAESNELCVYDLRTFLNVQVRSYTIGKVLDELRAKVDAGKGAVVAPNLEFLVQHGYDLLDQLDADNASLRTLFSMDDMTREGATSDSMTSGYYFFRLAVPSERLQKYFETTTATTGKEKRL
ncbi:hypothetical protein BBJ28_00002116 [Nothophytophthora sp. Chile5]|nr:hypothetical protein BBJ28_00002116 [Nothophytophthora sp. Chile5]